MSDFRRRGGEKEVEKNKYRKTERNVGGGEKSWS